jgi:hypothetical protein
MKRIRGTFCKLDASKARKEGSALKLLAEPCIPGERNLVCTESSRESVLKRDRSNFASIFVISGRALSLDIPSEKLTAGSGESHKFSK